MRSSTSSYCSIRLMMKPSSPLRRFLVVEFCLLALLAPRQRLKLVGQCTQSAIQAVRSDWTARRRLVESGLRNLTHVAVNSTAWKSPHDLAQAARMVANAQERSTNKTGLSFGDGSATVHSWCSPARRCARAQFYVRQLRWDRQEVGPAGGFMHHSLCVAARRLDGLPSMCVDEVFVVEIAIPPHPRRVSSPKCVPRHPIEFVRRQLRPFAAALYSSGRFNAGSDCTCSN